MAYNKIKLETYGKNNQDSLAKNIDEVNQAPGKTGFEKTNSAFFIVALMFVILITLAAISASAETLADTTRPTVISISPVNNEVGASTHDSITVQFSEAMDLSTINNSTFIVTQRTTPEAGTPMAGYRSINIDGTIIFSGMTATFIPNNNDTSGVAFMPKFIPIYNASDMANNASHNVNTTNSDDNLSAGVQKPSANSMIVQPSYNPMQPSQRYGNVYTVTLTTGIKDLSGNALSQDYMWSFTTGGDDFNTGSTTSQSNQSNQRLASGTGAAIIPPTIVQPPVNSIPAATGTQAANSAWYSSAWFIGLLFILLFVAILITFAMSMRPVREKGPQKTIRPTRRDPFGDVYPVADLEGIGPVYKKNLNAMGIKNTHQLWKADPGKISRVAGAPLVIVKSWQNMAELASVNGIGPQYAELLERSNIHNIDQLKNSEPETLLARVREKQASLNVNIQGNSPGYATVENWITEAKGHAYNDEAKSGQTA